MEVDAPGIRGGLVNRLTMIGQGAALTLRAFDANGLQRVASEKKLRLPVSSSAEEKTAVAWSEYEMPASPCCESPNTDDAGSQPGTGRLKMTFHAHGSSASSRPSFVNSTGPFGASSRVTAHMRKGQ